jgi:hypothetical protein
MVRRNSDSEAMRLLAVAAASPDTISLEGTYMAKIPSGTTNRYRNPASLAIKRGDDSGVWVVI